MTALEQIKKKWLDLVDKSISQHLSNGGQIRDGLTIESIGEATWKSLLKDCKRMSIEAITFTYSSRLLCNSESLELEVQKLTQGLKTYFSKTDTRDNTERCLDAMYGRGGWDASDRLDFEG